MNKKYVLTLIISIFKLSLLVAQTSTSFTVEGEVQRILKLSVNELVKLRNAEVKGKDKDGKEHVYTG